MINNNSEKSDSVKKRYLVTLIVNIFKIVSGVIASTIVPRSLGPTNYGNYQFIFRIATSFRGLLNLGSSQAFFTYNSKNTKSGLIFKVYSIFLFIQLLIILLIIALFTNFKLFHVIWLGQDIKYVILITILEWMNFVALNFIQLGESKAESVLVQKINLLVQVTKILLIVFLYVQGILSLFSYIIINFLAFVIIILSIYVFLIVKKRKKYFVKGNNENLASIKNYFISYCLPLVILTAITFGYTFFERWFLQVISGSVQQAYFSIAQQWNMVSLLFTTSILNIFWREISFSYGKNDIKRIRSFFPKTIKSVYLISTILSFYLAFNANFLLNNLAGKNYSGATMTLTILAFYPIHQTIGQLSSSFFLATEQTILFRNLGILSLIFGIVGTYFVLAPKTFFIPGLELNSAGLAAKMVILSIIFTNIYLFKISKYLKIEYSNFLKIQIKPIIIMFIISFLCFKGINQLFDCNIYLKFALISFIYFLIIGLVCYMKPEIVGFEKSQLVSLKSKLKSYLKNIF